IAAGVADPVVNADHIRPPTAEERAAYAAAKQANDEEALEQLRAKTLERQGMDRRQMRDIAKWWLARMIQTPRPLEEKLTLLWHGHFASNFCSVRDSYLLYQQNAFFRRHAAGNFGDLARGVI